MKNFNVSSNYSKRLWLCFSMALVALTLLIAPWNTHSEKAREHAQTQFMKIAAWNDDMKEIMFDQNPDALAAELNNLEPSN